MPVTVATFAEMKQKKTKISMLTAYDYTTARLVDEAGVDSILVGDSLGNVMLGLGSTIPVTMDEMIVYAASTVRGVRNALVIVDMPFMSYEVSDEIAVVNAGRLIKETGASAVKLEGGVDVAARIRAIVAAKIPVCAHIGLTPQGTNVFGGFKVQGKTADAAEQIIRDARAIEEAGAFAVVVEAVPPELAAYLTEMLSIPTIGIGAGPDCDGQVLVNQDMLGMFDDFTPRFVKRFAEIGALMKGAYADYTQSVKDGSFPAPEHCYATPAGLMDALPPLH